MQDRMLASFAGAGILDAGRIMAVLEALERRGASYHRQLPGESEVATRVEVEDRADPLGTPGVSVRSIRHGWATFHREKELDTRGLEGLKESVAGIPPRWLGFRVRMAYRFRRDAHEPLEVAFFQAPGERWEARLSVAGARFTAGADPKLAKADSLLLADLGEAVWDVLTPAYGAVRPDAGVLPDQVPVDGWGYYGAVLVERAGRKAVEALAGRCLKAWELSDQGWFLAPSPLAAVPGELEEARAALFQPIRHLTLEGMRGRVRADG